MRKLSKEQLKAIYNADYVSRYHSVDKIRIKKIFRFLNLDRNDVVLDVGCGNGLLLDYVYNKIKFYHGVDFSEEFIKVAQKKQYQREIKNAEFICKDIREFCGSSKVKFDKIFALDFVEHIYDDEFIEIFTLLFNLLDKNGKLFIHTPNGKYFLEVFKNKNIFKQYTGHVAVRTTIECKELLEKIGFNNIKIIYLPHYIKVLSLFDFLRYIPFVGEYFKARLFIICQK